MTELLDLLGTPALSDLDLTPIALAGIALALWLVVALRRRLARNRKTSLTLSQLERALGTRISDPHDYCDEECKEVRG